MQKHNYSAGPSILPKAVFEAAARAAVDYEGTGLSIMEVSHRGPEFIDVLEEAKALVLELLGIDDRYKVLLPVRWCKYSVFHDRFKPPESGGQSLLRGHWYVVDQGDQRGKSVR